MFIIISQLSNHSFFFFLEMPDGRVLWFYSQKHNVCTSCVFIFSLHSLALNWWLVAIWAALSTMAPRFFEERLWVTAAQWGLWYLSSTASSSTWCTRNFWKPQGSTGSVSLLLPLTNAGHQTPALGSSAHPTVSTSGFPPVPRNFDISLIGADWTCWTSFWWPWAYQGSKGSCGAELEMMATS